MEIFAKYPNLKLKERLEELYENRRNEILTELLEFDEYVKLRDERAEASMALREILDESGAELFEKYSDAVYAHEIHELDSVYRQAIADALKLLQESGLIWLFKVIPQ